MLYQRVEDFKKTDLWCVELIKTAELMKEDTDCFVETIKTQSFDLYQFNFSWTEVISAPY